MTICIQYEDEYFELAHSFHLFDKLVVWIDNNGFQFETDSAGEAPRTTYIVSLFNSGDYVATKLRWI